jgi:hypothetical protein
MWTTILMVKVMLTTLLQLDSMIRTRGVSMAAAMITAIAVEEVLGVVEEAVSGQGGLERTLIAVEEI